MSYSNIHAADTQELTVTNEYCIELTANNINVCDILPNLSADRNVTIANARLIDEIHVGSHSFTAERLGQLLSILESQYPELKV